MNGLFFTDAFQGLSGLQLLHQAYDRDTCTALHELLSMPPPVQSFAELHCRSDDARQTDFLFSTWGMPALSAIEIERYFPHLKAIFYAAGTVQAFARPFLERGVRVFSAASVNAIPVAEYAAAQIVLAGKGFFQASRRYATAGWEEARGFYAAMPGNYGGAVGLLGVGAIGSRVATLLQAYQLRVLAYDPFLSSECAQALRVEPVDIKTLFSTCAVISNHLADCSQTSGILDYALFSRMSPHATFLNTGRGAQVVEADLVRALRAEPGRTAVLDVTTDEPVRRDSPLLTLPGVVLTPHIAGSNAAEIARMGRFSLDCCKTYLSGGVSEGEVTLKALEQIA